MERPVKLRGDLNYLMKSGGDVGAVLEGSGVTFDAIEELIPLMPSVISFLTDRLAAISPPDFAVRAGRAPRFQNMGILGYYLLNCTTVREVIEGWNRYATILDYPLRSELIVDDRSWHMTFRARLDMSERANRFCIESTLAGVSSALRNFIGQDVPASSYWMPFCAPEDRDRYSAFGGVPIYFDMPTARITGERCDLDIENAVVDKEAKAICHAHCEHALALIGSSLSAADRVRGCLVNASGHLPSAGAAADMLGVSIRTLHRLLATEGCSYHQLVDDYRQNTAVDLLNRGMDLKGVAFAVGFRGAGSFSRAFRAWTGESPSRWRGGSKRNDTITAPLRPARRGAVPGSA